jgi:hypothetical protein
MFITMIFRLICWHKVGGSTRKDVTILTLGLRPKQGPGKVRAESATWESHSHFQKCKRVWRNESTHSQVDSHFGNWNPSGLPNIHRAVWKIKIHLIENFLIPFERS